jgi:hypothetical protein
MKTNHLIAFNTNKENFHNRIMKTYFNKNNNKGKGIKKINLFTKCVVSVVMNATTVINKKLKKHITMLGLR